MNSDQKEGSRSCQSDIGNSDCQNLTDAIEDIDQDNENRVYKCVSGENIEESVEMSMYLCLREKRYEALADIIRYKGGDINHTYNEAFVNLSNRGWTALHFACQKNNEDNLNLLLDLGADPSLTDKKGNTPLHVACKYGHFRMCLCILKRNKQVKDQQNIQGLTPLMKALFRFDTAFKEIDYDKTISSLIDAGCDVNLRPKSNMSPLHVVAGKWKSVEMVMKLLGAGADVNANTGSSSPLMKALSQTRVNVATVSALIDAGANVNYQNPSKKSVLHIAVSKSEDTCVEHLLAAGADPNIRDSDGNTSLWIAVSENDIKIAPLLLHYGGDVNFKNTKYRMSLLSKAVCNQNHKMIALLLNQRADINSLTALGASALHYAVDHGNLHIIKVLLRENPDMDNYSMFKDLYNPQNAFQIALSQGNCFVAKLLLLIGMQVPYYQVKQSHLPSIILDDEELIKWITDYMHTPRSLQHECIVQLRRQYRSEISTVVEQMTREHLIPRRIADKLMMKDILDIDADNNDLGGY